MRRATLERRLGGRRRRSPDAEVTEAERMEVEAAFERLAAYRGVQGCIVLDAQGVPIKTSMDVRCKLLR